MKMLYHRFRKALLRQIIFSLLLVSWSNQVVSDSPSNDPQASSSTLVIAPLPLTHTRSKSNVGQRQLISSSSSSSSSSSASNVNNDISGDNNNANVNNPTNNLIWNHLNSAEQQDASPLNKFCTIYYYPLAKVVCTQLEEKSDLPKSLPYFTSILHGVFLNTSSTTQIKLQDLKQLFPNLISLSITKSSNDDHNNNNLLNEIFHLHDEGGTTPTSAGSSPSEENPNTFKQPNSSSSSSSTMKKNTPTKSLSKKITVWPTIKILNLSNNNFHEKSPLADDDEPYQQQQPQFQQQDKHDEEFNSISISKILQVFPNLEQLELKGNRIKTFHNITRQNQLKSIDISDNPLDCTSEEIMWLERSNITLMNLEQTLCDLPPHQNRPKPILPTIALIKKVQEECRVNCSCEIDYIWEQEKVIHSKTSVNCSNRNLIDFPDPDKLPHPTDTLYLNNNHIRSMRKFVNDIRYTALNVMNLYLDNNEITSLNELDQSDWIYNFQILSLRRNNLTEIRVHLLENIIRLNKWVYQIDLSDNSWKCDCRTLSTFKVWLLQHYKFVRNIGNVKCGRTGREIRYLRNEDWCEMEESRQFIEFIDILNIFMAILILLIIGKVLYDYWNLSRHGKVPWLVGKIW